MRYKIIKVFIFGIIAVLFQGICLSGCSNNGHPTDDNVTADIDTLPVIDTVLVLQPNCVLTTESPAFRDSLSSLLQRDNIKSITYTVGRVIDNEFFKKLIPFVDLINENSDKIIRIMPYVIDHEIIPHLAESYKEWYESMYNEPVPEDDLEPFELVRAFYSETEAMTGEELKSAEILRLYRYYLKDMWPCHPIDFVVVDYDSKRFLVRKEFEGILFTKYGSITFIYEITDSIYDFENSLYPPPYITLCIEDSMLRIYPREEDKWLNRKD